MPSKPVKTHPAKGLWLRGDTYWLAATIPGRGRIRISLKTGDMAEAIQQARLIRAFPDRYFFRWAIDAVHVRLSPVALIIPPEIRPNPRKVYLLPADALRVLDEAEDPDLRFAIFCALHCGLRRGEVIASRPHWFDIERGLLHIQNEADWLTKNRDNRTIRLTSEFRDFLAWYGIQKPYMLRPDVAPKPSNRTWRYRTDFAKQFNGHLARLGLEDVTFHDLRRTFASLHVSRGTPLYHVAKWLGDHPNVVEQTYGHLLPNDARINDPWTQARKEGGS